MTRSHKPNRRQQIARYFLDAGKPISAREVSDALGILHADVSSAICGLIRDRSVVATRHHGKPIRYHVTAFHAYQRPVKDTPKVIPIGCLSASQKKFCINKTGPNA